MAFSETNVQLFRMINNLGKNFSFLNPAAVFIAEYALFILILSLVFFWIIPAFRNRMMVICTLLAVLIAQLIRIPVGRLHSNLQPFAELPNVNQLIDKTVGNSFPSDHTLLVFAFCVTFALFHKRFAVLWLLLAVLVGITRIWIGVHYPLDVAAGASISIVSAVIVFAVAPKLPAIQRLAAGNKKRQTLAE
ncbi:undecaprenyl-diphosphatase [Planomicrobium sp. HSC-17F08]|nr:undecaprenyl-diphosphatase [Planomicrobium sp. HSC-17F08]